MKLTGILQQHSSIKRCFFSCPKKSEKPVDCVTSLHYSYGYESQTPISAAGKNRRDHATLHTGADRIQKFFDHTGVDSQLRADVCFTQFTIQEEADRNICHSRRNKEIDTHAISIPEGAAEKIAGSIGHGSHTRH
jgi:hypothetical protein